MKSLLLIATAWTLSGAVLLADWPQWRGPQRNGVADESTQLPDTWAEQFQPLKVWESETIPSDHYGGHGSAVIANGKVYFSVVWHRDEPTETRTIDSRVMSTLNHRGHDMTPELAAKMETDRLNVSPRLRGAALDELAKAWVKENLTEKQNIRFGDWVISRFKQGKTAVPLPDYDIVLPMQNKEFPNQAAFEEWVKAQKWNSPATGELLLAKMPNTKVLANDVVMCLDMANGKTLWRFETPGSPAGRNASSTPSVLDGTVYALASDHLFALDAQTGKEKWRFATGSSRGLATSPLVAGGKVLIQSGKLRAVDAATGKLAWESADVPVTNSSPALWNDVVVCNASRDLIGLSLETGEVKWRQPAGGDGTPVISGDVCVVTSTNEEVSLAAFRLSVEGAQKMWSKAFLARRYGSSPVIYNGYVYHMGSTRHMCVDLQTGETKWEVERQSELSSPVVADGKILVSENNGGYLAMISTSPEKHTILGRANVSALSCPSPALDGAKAVLRMRDKYVCYDLSAAAPSGS